MGVAVKFMLRLSFTFI